MRVVFFAHCCARVVLVSSLVLTANVVSGIERSHPAKLLVQQALSSEIEGLGSQRDELLRRAIKIAPTYAPAKWHQGMVRFRGRWMKADEVPAQLANTKWLAAYTKARNQFPATAKGQLELANWCRDRKLLDQERAHLTRVLDFDPNNGTALLRLGFRQVNGRWVSMQELRENKQEREQSRRALVHWQPRINKIVQGLQGRKSRQREVAERQLRQINDVSAIPALQQAISQAPSEVALKLVDTLDNIRDNKAAVALARGAVFANSSTVREAAAQRLRSRQRDAYFPAMLATMQTPISTRSVSYRRGGFTIHLHAMTHESQTEKKQVVVQSLSDKGHLEKVQHQNYRTQVINERVSRALNIATDQDLPAKPQEWWDWWNEENEIYVEGEKQLYSKGATEQLARIDRIRELEEARQARQLEQQRQAEMQRQARAMQSSGQRRRDCLAAGTPVWTLIGPVAVEQIQAGDMVLAQDVETGELAYKPVLQTTVRPTSLLVLIDTGSDTIEASGGHPFWISGQGWVKARELKSGMEMHCVGGTVRIRSVTSGKEAETYNMIVADFSTYFVGESKILNHDNTIRKATNAIVPGLLKK